MPIDAKVLPTELVPHAEAIDVRPARPIWGVGWRAHEWPAPTVPLVPGAPPYDGVYRGSWISPGVCVRLDLAAVSSRVGERLRALHPNLLGQDGAMYLYGVAGTSQRGNRDEALLELALAIDLVGE